MTRIQPPLRIERPGEKELRIQNLVLDFTGTLSRDGALLPGVAERLVRLARQLRITVLTADTFGTVTGALEGLPVSIHRVTDGAAKARFVRKLGPRGVAAVGNGRNDVAMVRTASLGIAVIGPEGLCSSLIQSADVVTTDIRMALDLLLHPLRLTATLRK